MRFEVYESFKDGKFYWRLRACNGRVVADGAQGYKHRRSAVAMIEGIAFSLRDTFVRPVLWIKDRHGMVISKRAV